MQLFVSQKSIQDKDQLCNCC